MSFNTILFATYMALPSTFKVNSMVKVKVMSLSTKIVSGPMLKALQLSARALSHCHVTCK